MPIIEEPGQAHGGPEENSRHGRLSVRLSAPVDHATRTGPAAVAEPGGGLLALTYVPEPVDAGPYRLVVLLHGAGGSARQGLELMLPVADSLRLLLVAPESAGSTWDVISAGFGTDVRRLDRVLSEVLGGYPVDRMSVGGFSDGASYALSLGLTNGDLFDSILAFSPGFAAPMVTHGAPRVFISHGDDDRVLPIDRCSRRLVPRLRTSGYDVTYEEFRGGHEVPDDIVRRASAWLPARGDRPGG
ncbi:alpha/beta hydrolase [Actinoplanes sp. DH11]|uniref:alpha/beta hydrolase n=1 Tax=Actinoplanes sp. DH11 TaxID=2857011 RepID=UPI001E34DBD3|nr:phospholipase [Actinoplanes sp. DH11]